MVKEGNLGFSEIVE